MTIRDQIIEQVAERIRALPGWAVYRRDPKENPSFEPLVAFVLGAGEQPIGSDTMTVHKDLTIEVLVQVHAEGATEELDSNAERYLDQQVGLVEGAIFTPPNLPTGEDLRPGGWSYGTQPESNLMTALIRMQCRYRHNIGDPSTFNPILVT